MKSLVFIITFFFFTTESFSESMQQDTIANSIKKQVIYDTNSTQNPIIFNEKIIEGLKKDSDFDYTEIEKTESWWTKFTKWIGEIWNSFWYWLFGDYEGNSGLVFFVNMLPYLIISGIIGFIIWLFFKLNPGASILKSKEKPELFFTKEEELIKSKDIRKLIDKALENKNYRLAIRYYYLLILKKLTNAHIIEYEFDKTNTDYIKEIVSEDINKNFIKVTILYDYIWYGNFAVSKIDYNKAQQDFIKLEDKIIGAND